MWKYKFTWAPKNVVLAGQGKSSVYLQNGKKITVPYSELFLNTTPINSSKLGKLEAYPNRDSLQYKEIYNLSTAETVLRSTVRYPGFCAAWWVFVRLGMTNNKKILSATAKMSYCEYVQLFLPKKENDTVEKNFQKFLNLNDKQDVWKKLLELDIFSTSKKIGINKATSAQILEKILKESWTLASNETDVVVMKHSVSYLLNNKKETIHSELILEGVNNLETAMAACVGLPVAMAAILILKNKINVRGVQIPIYEEIYEPILEELKLNGIGFTETHA